MTRYAAWAVSSLVATISWLSPAQGAVLTLTGQGTLERSGTPVTLSFSWDTSVRPVVGTQPAGPVGEPAPVFATNPLRPPLTVSGPFGQLSYDDLEFTTRYEGDQVRYSVSSNTSPPSQPLRIVSFTITAPKPADPYNTDLPSDLTGLPVFFSFFDERVSSGLDGGAVSFGRGIPAVPEPASWAMMLVGFAAVGAALRRGERRLPATVR